MKPQSSQRVPLCSPTDYVLMKLIEELYPVLNLGGYRY
jgi:hypothetical protein